MITKRRVSRLASLPFFVLIKSVASFCFQRVAGLTNLRLGKENSIHGSIPGDNFSDGMKIWSTLNESNDSAVEIATSFQISEFDPANFATNRHFQTVAGVVLRNYPEFAYWDGSWQSILKDTHKQSNDKFWDKRKRFETPDGDFFDVDYKYFHETNEPFTRESYGEDARGVVIMTHGIESSSDSPLAHDMGKAFLAEGFDVACINFRGCSGEPNRNLGSYHFGFTDDLKQFIIETRNDSKMKPIFLSGFSLGANVVLKLMGELGDTAKEELNIWGAAVTGAPFNLRKNNDFMNESPFNRILYINTIVESIKGKALTQIELNQPLLDTATIKPINIQKLRSAQTQGEFENEYTAPIYGFRDNVDYYEQTSCTRFIDDITVPTLVINSMDDPFFSPDSMPKDNPNRPMQIASTKYGGHLGFMFQKVRTRNQRMVNASWMPSELARFLDHVYNKTT